MTPHKDTSNIGDAIADKLAIDGWTITTASDGQSLVNGYTGYRLKAEKRLPNIAQAGAISDGHRFITICLTDCCKFLSRHDPIMGFIFHVNLQNHNDATQAIDAAIYGEYRK